MVVEVKFPKRPSGYIVYNDDRAEDTVARVTGIICAGQIYLINYIDEDLVLVHPAIYHGRVGVRYAMLQLLPVFMFGNIVCDSNDEMVRELLGDPNFSTRKVLTKLLQNELRGTT